ncbi:MAG: FtsQ-type POTRA domain-containing protein [Peptostreptococcaceae bacterium]|nr:FtsQ-type POTRA domain-containing protein [Peptostreptococcaceae bacterium]MDY5739114.1 FtsQ-type POTRA domain-containing protein [Anaerovoracaceae bacterium]
MEELEKEVAEERENKLDDESTLSAFQKRKEEERKQLVDQLNNVDVAPRAKRRKKHYGLRFLGIVIGIVGFIAFITSGFFDVKEIKVEGNTYFTPTEIIGMADGKLGGNIFWGSNMSYMKKRIVKNPYFEQVTIDRRLPDKLVIKVVEKKQTAAFIYGDEYVVVDKESTVLRKSDVDPKLTLLTGLNISKIKQGEPIEVEQEKTLKTTLNMIDSMEKGDLYFKKIDVSEKIIKAYIYDGLYCKGSPKQMIKNIENGNLQKVVNRLIKDNTVQGVINLGNHDFISYSPS